MALDSKNGNRDFEAEARAYLNKVRRTISESEALIAQAEMRVAETDRFLESQGLTRAQVEAMSFTDEQMDAVNAELKRRGMAPLDEMLPPAIQEVSPRKATSPGTSGVRRLCSEHRQVISSLPRFSGH